MYSRPQQISARFPRVALSSCRELISFRCMVAWKSQKGWYMGRRMFMWVHNESHARESRCHVSCQWKGVHVMSGNVTTPPDSYKTAQPPPRHCTWSARHQPLSRLTILYEPFAALPTATNTPQHRISASPRLLSSLWEARDRGSTSATAQGTCCPLKQVTKAALPPAARLYPCSMISKSLFSSSTLLRASIAAKLPEVVAHGVPSRGWTKIDLGRLVPALDKDWWRWRWEMRQCERETSNKDL